MDRTKHRPRRRSIIWSRLTGMTGRLYHAIGQSALGRAMTAYRRADALLHHERRHTLRDNCRPMSRARLKLVETVRSSRLLGGIGGFFSLLAYAPARFYGLFLLLNGLFSGAAYFLDAGLLADTFSVDPLQFIPCGVLMLMGFPLLLSGKPMAALLLTGRLTRWFFVGLLGLPDEAVDGDEEKPSAKIFRLLSPYLAILAAGGCAVASLWFHPYVIPSLCLLVALTGMIMAYPETGVILSVSTLPFLFFSRTSVLVSVAVIAVTWLSYVTKLLFMHRTIRFNLIDVAVLLFALSIGLSGMTGGYITTDSVWTGILCFVIFSLYFLITNLLTERDQLRRCLVGPVVTLLGVLAMMGASLAPDSLWDWLGGSRGGNLLRTALLSVKDMLSAQASAYRVCLPMMAVPFCVGLLMQKGKRLRHYLFLWALLLLSLVTLYLSGAYGPLAVSILCVVLFFLLYHHRALAAGILALPWLAMGGIWAYTLIPHRINGLLTRWASAQTWRETLWRGAWRTVCDYPAGIGLGDRAFSSVYPLYADAAAAGVTGVQSTYVEILLDMGIPGLVLFLFMAFLFVQKTFTCLRVVERLEDHALMLGGMLSYGTLLLYGLFSDAPVYLPMLMTAVVALGLCSAFENTVFTGWDMTVARMSRDQSSADCILHVSQE